MCVRLAFVCSRPPAHPKRHSCAAKNVHTLSRVALSQACRVGQRILAETCSACSPETGGQGAFAAELLEIVNVMLPRGALTDIIHFQHTCLSAALINRAPKSDQTNTIRYRDSLG